MNTWKPKRSPLKFQLRTKYTFLFSDCTIYNNYKINEQNNNNNNILFTSFAHNHHVHNLNRLQFVQIFQKIPYLKERIAVYLETNVFLTQIAVDNTQLTSAILSRFLLGFSSSKSVENMQSKSNTLAKSSQVPDLSKISQTLSKAIGVNSFASSYAFANSSGL